MPVVTVDDPGDPRIAAYRRVRERDLVGRDGVFLAEGEVVVRQLLSPRSRARPLSLLVSAGRLPVLERLPALAPDLPVYVAGQPVVDAIVGFPIHRGLLGLGERPREPDLPDLLPAPPGPVLALALLGLANHDNVGAAFRNAAAFGADAVLLDRASCDPLYRKAIRVSAGTALTLPFRRGGSAEDWLGTLRDLRIEAVALSPRGEVALEAMRWPDRTCLVVGSEGPGLPANLLARLPTVRIAMAPGVDSLNVATAAAIALHAASRDRPDRARGAD